MSSLEFTNEDFLRMYHASWGDLVQAYLEEEQVLIERLYRQRPELKKSGMIEVGGGSGGNIERMEKMGCLHVVVDPFPKAGLSAICVRRDFEHLSLDLLPPGPKVYFFHFNVAAYVRNLPDHLSRLIQANDTVFFSQWRDTDKIRKTYADYFHFFTQGRFMGSLDPFSEMVLNQKRWPCLHRVQQGKLCELWGVMDGAFNFMS